MGLGFCGAVVFVVGTRPPPWGAQGLISYFALPGIAYEPC